MRNNVSIIFHNNAIDKFHDLLFINVYRIENIIFKLPFRKKNILDEAEKSAAPGKLFSIYCIILKISDMVFCETHKIETILIQCNTTSDFSEKNLNLPVYT